MPDGEVARATAAVRPVPAATRLVPVLVFMGMVAAIVSSLGAPLIPTIARVDRPVTGSSSNR